MRSDSTRVEMHFPFPFQAAPARAKIIENRLKMSSLRNRTCPVFFVKLYRRVLYGIETLILK